MATASDASAELVKLGEAKAFGVVEDHQVRVRDIDPDFDDGGGNEGLSFSAAKIFHHRVFFFGAEFAVDEPDVFSTEAFLPCAEGLGGGFGLDGFAFLDEGINEVGLAAICELGFHEVGDVFLFRLVAEGGDDFTATRRFFIEQ